MAEIIGTVSAIVGLIQVSGEVLVAGYGFISRVRKAPTMVQNLLNEVSALNTLLGRLWDFASTDRDEAENTLQALDKQGVFDQCKESIVVVEKIIKSCTAVEGDSYGKNFIKNVKYPFKEDEAKKTMDQLDRLRSKLTDAITLDTAAAIMRIEDTDRHIKQGVDQLNINQETDTLSDWIFPVDVNPEENYRTALEARQPGTGSWLLKTDLFHQFVEKWGLYWIFGLPGCGKTVLSTTVVEHVAQNTHGGDDGLVYFYCDYRDPSKQSFRNFLMSAVKQLVGQRPELMECIRAMFNTKRNDFTRKPTTQEYCDLLHQMSRDFVKVYIVLDGLDEAEEIEDFVEFLVGISNKKQATNLSILITSRTNIMLENTLLPVTSKHMSLTGLIQHDINAYISDSIEKRLKSRKLKLRDPSLASVIKERIIEQSAGLFLQARLHLEHISTMKNDRSIKVALENLPNALESTYERILRSILTTERHDLNEVKKVLYWLSQSLTPLTLDMLAEAVAISPEDTFLDREGIATDPEDVVEALSSLITIDRLQSPPTVSLSHYSIDEYLRSKSILESPVSFFHINSLEANRYIADTCLQYLSFDDFEKPALFNFHNNKHKPNMPRKKFGGRLRMFGRRRSFFEADKVAMPELERRLQDFALLHYASEFWPIHIHLGYAQDDISVFQEKVEPKLQWFLHPETSATHQYESWMETHYFYCNDPDDCEYYQPPLYHAIRLGLNHAVSLLLPVYIQTHDINEEFPGGWTPLTIAAMRGSVSISQLLLDTGANVDRPAEAQWHNSFTALQLASERANARLVEFLLTRNASVHAKTRTGTTAFYRAARGGSPRVLELLYQAGSDVGAATWDGYTALIEAVANRDARMVQKLLEWGAHALKDTRGGFNALDLAQEGGDTETAAVITKWIAEHKSESADDHDNDDYHRNNDDCFKKLLINVHDRDQTTLPSSAPKQCDHPGCGYEYTSIRDRAWHLLEAHNDSKSRDEVRQMLKKQEPERDDKSC